MLARSCSECDKSILGGMTPWLRAGAPCPLPRFRDKSYSLPVVTYTGHQINRLEEIRSAGWWPGFQISSLEALFFDE